METFCIVYYEYYLSMGPAQFKPLEIHHVQCASNHTHKMRVFLIILDYGLLTLLTILKNWVQFPLVRKQRAYFGSSHGG
jgi:hypothetical protein